MTVEGRLIMVSANCVEPFGTETIAVPVKPPRKARASELELAVEIRV
jgi:hypothetical protein